MFLSAALLLFTASCSNDENSNEAKEPTQTIQFSFTNEDFGEDETLTRTSETAKPQTIDLGDCEAEISVESEPAAKKTRGALSPATGHYTIRAYQAGTLKDEMKGTFSGGTFTPDASSQEKMLLPHGTYDFVAFNDDVTPSGNDLTVARNKAETAMIGTVTENINQDPDQTVSFTMKHVGCRLRTQFVCQKHIPENITAKLEATAANVIPTTTAYHPATKAYTSTNGAMTAENSNSPASTEDTYWDSNFGQDYAYTSTSDYHYFLPTTDASKLKLTFTGGTVFWKPLTGGIIPQLSTALPTMQLNKSYVVKIKFKPNYIYLMSDGTTGHFKDTTFGGGTKTPVGVVADPTARVAIALKNVSDVTAYYWCDPALSPSAHANNTTLYTSTNRLTDMEGYKWTWEAAGSTDGAIKANQQTTYPAFYEAGHYNPGVTLSGTLVGKKWYLAGWGEWINGVKYLGFNNSNNLAPTYGVLLDETFTKVGGTKLTIDPLKNYLISTQSIDGTPPVINYHIINFHSDGDGFGSGTSPHNGLVRPFIKY